MSIASEKFTRMGETFAAAIGLAALSDFLLFDGQLGLSVVVLGFFGALAALVINRHCGPNRLALGALVYALSLLPVLENLSLLSFLVSISLAAVGTLIISDDFLFNVTDVLWRLLRFFLTLPVRSLIDTVRWRKMAVALSLPVIRFARLGVWIMPLIAGLVFLALFEDANPIIAALIAKIDLWYLFQGLDIVRVLFWALMFVLIWPFLRARLPERKAKIVAEPVLATPSADRLKETFESILFGPAAILRSLLVFNALFAVQSLLDATYLVGGVSLPEGMSYANYAHRGAYPLIVTALLAAGFVLAALREGSAARESGLIRTLVYVWVAQNILLVLSSILRLDLYVGVYGLTYWRIAAFLWMGLVAIGLLTIIWRIWGAKSAEWLIGANVLTAVLVLYVSCFVNFAGSIARSNNHSETKDFYYSTRNGPHVLPVIDGVILSGGQDGYVYFEGKQTSLSIWRVHIVAQFRQDYRHWRLWSLRNWRLKRYLDEHPFVTSKFTREFPEMRR